MPFIDAERREEIRMPSDCATPGERCYLTYLNLIQRWRAQPRWTTIDGMVEKLFPELSPQRRADFLAFLVFMGFHGFPYEEKMREKNGDI